MPRRSRINWPFLFGLAAFAFVLGHYIAWPMIEQLLGATAETGNFGLPYDAGEESRERAMHVIASLWFFVFGASIGSFLNVVAYRMPMGLTFVSKPSRCPYCETPILFKHNVPILGWLMLRGRCNACRLPISARYIIVELVVGMIFFTLFCQELASGGRNLPIREPSSRPGMMWNLFTPKFDLLGLYAFHVFLLGVLATVALIKFDKLKIPPRLGFFALAMGIALRCVWPHLSILSTHDWIVQLSPNMQIQELVNVTLDLGFGFVCGAVVQVTMALSGRRPLRSSCCGSLLAFCLVAVFLGWQAVVPMLVIGSLIQLLATIAGRVFVFSTNALWGMTWLVATWLTLCFWLQLPSIWIPGAESPWNFQVAGLALGLAAVVVAENLMMKRSEPRGE